MPPNGNAGASSTSSFLKGNGRAKYPSSHRAATSFALMIESASASATRDFRTYIVIGRLLDGDVTVVHGPAANAIRYVLMGSVSANTCSVGAPRSATVVEVAGPFANTRHSFGARNLSDTRALRSG